MTIASRSRETIDWASLPLLIGEKLAAVILGVSLSYLRKSRSEGTRHNRTPAPPFVRIDGRCYYRVADLRDWVNDLTPQSHG